MKRLVLALCGLPAAGKSEVADNLAACIQDAAVLRAGTLLTLSDQLQTSEIPLGIVIIDAPTNEDDAVQLIDLFGEQLVFVVLDASITSCHERHLQRGGTERTLTQFLEMLRTPHIQAEAALIRAVRERAGTIIVETDGVSVAEVVSRLFRSSVRLTRLTR